MAPRDAFSGRGAGSGLGGFSTSSSRLSYIFQPPSFSDISDANVIVAFKNLLKKDSTTKAKALEELIAYAAAHPHDEGGTEDAILDAWVRMYPRASIDNSRRVRELSHRLQCELMNSAKHRMGKRLAASVGPWIAGNYDKDRGVAGAAIDGLSTFCDTEEKLKTVLRKCSSPILDYAQEAIQETPDTLSDARTTSKEDVEAKYHRVMVGSLCLVLSLLTRADLEAINAEAGKFFAKKTVWSLAAAPDSFLRRALYRLLQAALDKVPHIEVHVHNFGQILVLESLQANQTNSAADLVRVLTSITERFPEVWGSKKSPLERLGRFLELGSQGSLGDFWHAIDKLLALFSRQDLSVGLAANVLKAMRTGFSRRDQPPDNFVFAWACYINTFGRFMEAISPTVSFVQENFYPLTRQYLHPTQELSSWTCSDTRLYPKAWDIVLRQTDPELEQSVYVEWSDLADQFLSRLSNSLPEVSADFQKSQEDIGAEGHRWFTVSSAVLAYRQSETMSHAVGRLKTIVTEASRMVIRGACEQLTKRNYKPYGAAATLKSALEKCPDLFRENNDDYLDTLFPPDKPEGLDTLLKSSSFEYLVSCLQSLARIPALADPCKATTTNLIDVVLRDGGEDLASRLNLLLSDQPGLDIAVHHTALQETLVVLCTACASGSNNAWALLDKSLSLDLLATTSLHQLLGNVLNRLEHDGVRASALKALELVLSKRPSLLGHAQTQMTALATLLALSEISDDTIAKTAVALQVRIEELNGTSNERPMIKIIQRNLESASPLSLDVDTLVKQAHSCADSLTLEQLFPDPNTWRAELLTLLSVAPNPALALTSSLGGAYHLVKRSNNETPPEPPRDRDGRSIPARMALYTSHIFASGMDLDALPLLFHIELLFLLCLTVELAADQLSIPVAHGLWTDDQSAMTAMETFVSSGRKTLNSLAGSSAGWHDDVPGDSLMGGLLEMMICQSRDFTSVALYSAKALSTLLQAMTEAHGFPSNFDTRFPILPMTKATSSTVFPAAALLAGFGSMLSRVDAVNHLCNNMVSQLAGAFPMLPSTLATMVLLNACFSVYEPGTVPVDHRRMAIAIKQMTFWAEVPDEVSAGLAAETCKGIQNIAPNVGKLHGPYWEQSVGYCLHLWHRAPRDSVAVRLPYLHASLKLLVTLETIENPNDDLSEALKDKAMEISQGLISVLAISGGDGDSRHSPARIVNGILSRRAEEIPEGHVDDGQQLYSLIASESKDIQTAGFSLVGRHARLMQEVLSLEALLDNDNPARLPEELLSLLLDAPTLEAFPDDVLNQFPAAVRAYLLTWSLVFRTMGFSAYKLRNDYAEQLKTENYLPPLLAFLFDVLGHSAGHPLNLDKAGFTSSHIRVYDIQLADAEPAERSMQWLLIHLFYEILHYVPGLFKAWFLDCRSKQTKIAVESWTTRFFSPLIVADMLDAVMEWQDEKDDEDEPRLHLRVSRAAREIVASYEVDELEGAIVVRVPQSYPLETVTVEGINRVAVSEKKWQSWLLSTQGSIVFANGSIIDGLSTFRRNVVGALKGRSECAICYSIVSSDKRMPDKRCSTCKNLFHRSCLYKWFQSSNQNSCPLCRNPIDYLGHVH